MKYDKNGFLIFNSATDSEDSPVAATMALVSGYNDVDASLYFNNYYYQRCANAKYTMSRDNSLALFLMLKIKYANDDALPDLVDTSRVNGRDVFILNGAHIRACKGFTPYKYQTWILKKSIEFSVKKDPMSEQNQMIFQMLSQPNSAELLKWYMDLNPKWEESVTNWLRDRDEEEFSKHFIYFIKNGSQ